MSYIKNNLYREIPFCPETRYDEFYTYVDLTSIREKCENELDAVLRCRTLGILQSLHGRFYLSDFNSSASDPEIHVQVSVVYLQTPPQSTIVPYPVQVFGTLQWKNRPVIFAKLLKVLSVSTAIRLKNALAGITSLHLASNISTLEDEHQEDTN